MVSTVRRLRLSTNSATRREPAQFCWLRAGVSTLTCSDHPIDVGQLQLRFMT